MKPSVRRSLWLLGPARVEQIPGIRNLWQKKVADGVPRFRSRRTVALLGYLAAERRPIAREFLSALFWPDEVSSRGRANLSRELHNLSQILPDCWELDRQTVAFVPANDTAVDLYELSELEAQECWQEAIDLLGGEFLEGLYLDDNPEFENWLLGERERWRARAKTLLERSIIGYIRRGRYSDAINQARRLLQFAPWDEPTHRRIMRLLAWTGQREEALRQFERCRQTLREELGVEPAPETIALDRQIRTGILELPPQLPAFLTAENAKRQYQAPPFVERERELARLDAFLREALAGQGRVIFITGGPGRGKTALLDAFAQRAMEAHPDLLVARGNCDDYSGVGDPYLPFRDVMAMLSGDVENRWDTGVITREHAQRLWTAMPLVIQALLEHGPYLVDVLVPGAELLTRAALVEGADAPWLTRLREYLKSRAAGLQDVEQSHFFEQFTVVLCSLARKQPLLLILDDIQWADTASISLLFHLGRRLANANSRILITCAYRPEEVTLGRTVRSPSTGSGRGSGRGERHPLAKVLGEFKITFGDVWLRLEQVEGREERRFMDALLDIEPNRLRERFRAKLFDRTEGHPLFTIEMLRAMQERGDLLKDEEDAWIEGPRLDWAVLPTRVEAVIEERIHQLDPASYEILKVASVEGEMFTAQVVAEVQNLSERFILRQLSQDLGERYRLVKEQEEIAVSRRRLSRHRFSHALFRDYVYKHLCAGERRLLHGDVGAALEKLYVGRLDEMVVALAHHFCIAEDYERAFQYAILAAERAARLYENREAITHYTHALQLSKWLSPDVAQLASLHRERGVLAERLGEFAQARADHRRILQMARAAGKRQIEWRALLDLAKLWRARDYSRTRDYLVQALDLARQLDDPAALAATLNWLGNWLLNMEEIPASLASHAQALEIFEQLGDRQAFASTLNLLGIASLIGGDMNASAGYYDRAVALFREMDDRLQLAASLTGRALTEGTSSSLHAVALPALPIEPHRDFAEAQRLAQEIGAPADEAWALWAWGLLHMVEGRYGAALEAVQRSHALAAGIGHREWIVGSRCVLAQVYVELLAPDRALQQLELALPLAEELCSRHWIHNGAATRAAAYGQLGDWGRARACLESVLSAGTLLDTLQGRCCWVRRAQVALAQGDPALALDIAEQLIASTPGLPPGGVLTVPWMLKGEALAALGRRDEAVSLLHAALENAQTLGERFLLWRLHASLGRIYLAMNDLRKAPKEFSAARDLIDELAATIPDETLKENFLQGAYQTLLVSHSAEFYA